jgi:hypothetical protein
LSFEKYLYVVSGLQWKRRLRKKIKHDCLLLPNVILLIVMSCNRSPSND